MKFNFKIQQYQTDAVENTVNVFAGQPSRDGFQYRRDIGKVKAGSFVYEEEYIGFRNNDIELTDQELFANVKKMQELCDIPLSGALSHDLGRVGLDIEMETGTGKTYVYIKTMFELNKRYGWSKFIVVVPSIAIREGVYKSFCVLEDHFMEHYGKKARFFIYNSSNLQQLDSFSSDAGINVMIINTQAFASSLKEGAKNKESRIIYSERDDFGSRKPIDVLAANRPIIIMDEPQKMEGAATQTALKRFKPLFVLYYSATHKTSHNCIYALDALDAYKRKLVKKIQVKGFEVKNIKGNSAYLYLDDIILSKNKPPQAKIELQVQGASAIRRESRRFDLHDSLYAVSGLKVYDGFTISDIDAFRGCVTFLNGLTLYKGEVYGDTTEEAMQRVQIRETIASHFEKERTLFEKGIKTLSLFFIDEVAHYKSYDEEGNVVKGPAIPPYTKAIDSLENLRQQKLWQAGKTKEYYSSLTDIAREYIEGQFDVNAVEMTTDDILEEIKPLKFNDEVFAKFKDTMELADLVKFAKYAASNLENDIAMNNMTDFVNESYAHYRDMKAKEEMIEANKKAAEREMKVENGKRKGEGGASTPLSDHTGSASEFKVQGSEGGKQ